MAEVLFEIPEWLDYADYDNYPTQAKPTTNADFVNYATNQNKLVGALTAAILWQPNTNFIAGKIIVTPNMPKGMEAVALTGGFTGTVEPAWESDIAEYQDSGVRWQLRYRHYSKSIATQSEAEAGTDNTKVMTPKGVGYRLNKDRQISTFSSLESLGLNPATATPKDIVEALPPNSYLCFYASANTSGQLTALGLSQSSIVVVESSLNDTVPTSFRAYPLLNNQNNFFYIGHYKSLNNLGFTGWVKVTTEEDLEPLALKKDLEPLALKKDLEPLIYVVERVDGESGYIKYSNGDVEQWGRITLTNLAVWATVTTPVTFLVPHIDKNISVFFTPNGLCTAGWAIVDTRLVSVSTLGFGANTVYGVNVDGATITTYSFDWRSKGRWK